MTQNGFRDEAPLRLRATRRGRRLDGLAGIVVPALLLLAASAFWLHRIHDSDTSPASIQFEDWTSYFHPTATFIHNELRDHHLPLWNPYSFAGQPFLALHVPGVLYPPNLALLLSFSAERALAIHAVLHLWIAGWFAWLFAARLGLNATARAVVGIVYMFSTPVIASLGITAYLSTEAWLPAILWAVHGLLSELRWRWVGTLGTVVALAFLGGHSQGFVYEMQLAGAYGIFGVFFITERGARKRALGLAACGGLLALGLSAPQLLPALELARGAVRGFQGVTIAQATYGSISLDMLSTGLLGAAFLSEEPTLLQLLVVWPVFGVLLLPLGVFAKAQRLHFVFFVSATLLAGLFMAGLSTPVYEMYYALPLGDFFRVPMRLSFVYMFLAALVTGIAFEGLTDVLARAARPGISALATALLLVIAVDVYTRTARASENLLFEFPAPPAPASLVDALNGHGERRDRAWISASTRGRQHLGVKPGMMNQFFSLPDYEPTMPADYQGFFLKSESSAWHGFLDLEPDPRAAPQRPLRKLLDLMSVRYYIARESAARTPGGLRAYRNTGMIGQPRPMGEFLLLERPNAVPRSYAVRCNRFEPDFHAAMRSLESSDFHPLTEAVVTGPVPPAGSIAARLNRPCTQRQASDDVVVITSYEPEEVRLHAICTTSCLVVLTDLYYPGWRVSVDGEERAVERVNALFRGVHLDAGSHEVVYRFAPGSFRLGLLLCCAALLIAVFIGTSSRLDARILLGAQST